MSNKSKKIAISGAGIGGLTLAIVMQRLGIDFSIYEKAASFEPLGFGIQISPNAVRVLDALGLHDEIAAISNVCQGMEIRDLQTDKILLAWKIKGNVPYYQCMRSDLHQMLYQKVSADTAVQYNVTINSVDDVQADCIVAADGVHSNIRQRMFPGQQACFSGYVAYRAVLPYDERFAILKNKTTVWLSEDKHIVVYPVGQDNQINVALISRQPHKVNDSWVQTVGNDEILKRFKSKNGLINDLLSYLQQQNSQNYYWGLFDYQPLPAWHDVNHVLLGDAAHPMLPFMAQGAAMAIEDAWVLGHSLYKERNFEQACRLYQSIRYQRAAKVQSISRKNAEAFHANGVIKLGRNGLFSLLQFINPQLMHLKTDFLYGYDVTKKISV